MGGGDTTTKQESTFVPSKQQQMIMDLAFPYLKQFAMNPPGAPTGTAIAPFNDTQTKAQQMLLAQTPGLEKFAGNLGKANQFLFSGDVLDPNTNPGLRGAIDAATRPIVEKATHDLLPAIRGDAVTSGQYSGTKRGLMEQDLADAVLRDVGETSNNLVNQTYGANLEAMTRGQALAPQVMQSMLTPGLITSAVGDTRHGMEQAQASEAYQQARMSDMWNLLLGQELMGTSMMIPGGTNVSTATAPGPSPMQQIFGGVSALAPLFAFL